MTAPSTAYLRTFVCYMEDKPGVLNRITSLFRRRCYNIVSLNVGQTQDAGTSRMTFQVEADASMARLIEANVYKLVNVLSIEDITAQPATVRDLALIKVSVGADRRREVLDLVSIFRARAVDVSAESMTVEITGEQNKLARLAEQLEPFGILEMVRTGTVAMTRGAQGAAARVAYEAEAKAELTLQTAN